jgi:hypothetical protein
VSSQDGTSAIFRIAQNPSWWAFTVSSFCLLTGSSKTLQCLLKLVVRGFHGSHNLRIIQPRSSFVLPPVWATGNMLTDPTDGLGHKLLCDRNECNGSYVKTIEPTVIPEQIGGYWIIYQVFQTKSYSTTYRRLLDRTSSVPNQQLFYNGQDSYIKRVNGARFP